jgi:hypothetical protein
MKLFKNTWDVENLTKVLKVKQEFVEVEYLPTKEKLQKKEADEVRE